MSSRKLGLEIQSRVTGFIEYLFLASGQRNLTLKAKEVLDKIPNSLKNQIYQEINEIYI